METGISHTSIEIVTGHLTAQHLGSGDLPVLATPAMVALMENAAMLCVAPHLQAGETTVGSRIETTHLRPTPVGEDIRATATLTATEGRKLTFHVEATDKNGLIGEGTHVRYIVSRERFMAKMK